MRIHTNTLTDQDIRDAARRAGVDLYRMTAHGSRRRARAYDVILEGTGRTGTRYGQNTDMIAATWDEWDIFLAELFRRDDRLTIPRVYEDGEHFRWATYGRYDGLTPDRQHVRHRWERHGHTASGSYTSSGCRCGATVRRPWRLTWAQISAATSAVC